MKTIAMRLVIAAILLIAFDSIAHAAAAYEFRNGPATIRITDETCHQTVAVLLPAGAGAVFIGGYVTLRGVSIALCWRLTADGNILVIDARGDGGIIPASRFEKVPTI